LAVGLGDQLKQVTVGILGALNGRKPVLTMTASPAFTSGARGAAAAGGNIALMPNN